MRINDHSQLTGSAVPEFVVQFSSLWVFAEIILIRWSASVSPSHRREVSATLTLDTAVLESGYESMRNARTGGICV